MDFEKKVSASKSAQKRLMRLKYVLLGALGWLLFLGTATLPIHWLPSSFVASSTAQYLSSPAAQAQAIPAQPTETNGSPVGAPAAERGSSTEGMEAFATLTASLEKQTGLFTVYSDLQAGKSYLAIAPEQLNQNFLLITTLESGLGEAGLFRGWSINDLMIQFREAPDNHLQVVVPNTTIRDTSGQNRQQRLIDSSFSDSIIFAVPVVSIDPTTQTKLIDLSALFLERDLANLSQALSGAISGYSPDSTLSRVDSLKLFDENLELGTTIGYASDGSGGSPFGALFGFSLQGLADTRGFSLGIRYSLSALPENNGYQPRLADERVGYFLSAFRTPLQPGQSDPFIRYINRWHLEKQNPSAELSVPKRPIVFWIENTVPPDYRDALKEGALLWNEAFEQAGFKEAIVVEQMPDNADWDPADVRYNTIRWSDSLRSNIAGVGQSRVNPLTGEILNANIVLDANVIQGLQQQYQARGLENANAADGYLALCGQQSQDWYVHWLALQNVANPTASTNSINNIQQSLEQIHSYTQQLPHNHCSEYLGDQKTAFGALALSVLPHLTSDQLETYIQQHLVMLTAHEVGHTLGLRHNFAGSRLLSPEQLNNKEITREQGLVSSLMDYIPPNIAPAGEEQGDFFPTRLGAYDLWAIEYGYKDVLPSPRRWTQQQSLRQIAARSNAPELAYATDEDIYTALDPEADAWDLSSDPLKFAQWQLDNAQTVWQRLNRLSVSRGEGFGSLRRRVDLVFAYFRNNTMTLTNYVGGQRFQRLNPWETGDRTPLEPISASKQREALSTLNQVVFAPDAFQFSPQLLNQLPPDRWRHRGASPTSTSLEYPIYERVLSVQGIALSDLLSAQRLSRVRDAEFKSRSEDVFTIAELFESLRQGIWTEVSAPEDTQDRAVSSLRRGLQRHHLNILSNLVLRRSFEDIGSVQTFVDFTALATTIGAPEDARVLARYQLGQLYDDIALTLRRHHKNMDLTTQAHWEDILDRIDHVLEAPLSGA
ncbi:MAG: zinc-dependent metalloprotease [Cyanobacteria bacterium J06606_4]